MKHINLVIIFACSVSLTACAYRGAVYSEYQQMALDVRASAASGAPVQVNFGYDRGVFAYVPKQNDSTNSTQGEAVSVVSWNNMATELNPTKTSTNSVLRADAGFISGTAADVVSAPAGSSVTIVAPHLTKTVSVTGSPGQRIAAATAAFAPATIHTVSSDVVAKRDHYQKRLAGIASDAEKVRKILTAAGGPDVRANEAVMALSAYIAETSTEDGFKRLEDAFSKNP